MRHREIPFSRPMITEDEVAEVVDTLRSGWLTTGPKTKMFEREFAAYIGCAHAVAVNSCTAALHLALDAAGVRRDDIVITTPMTFAATAEVITYFGARPLFVDVEEATMNMSPPLLEQALRRMGTRKLKRVRAVIPVHMAGHPCDMDAITAIARRYGVKVIEDAAHTLPAGWNGKRVGAISDITAFSFYATKCITTGEGGMVVTDNDGYAERMRMMSLHGISRDAWKRYAADGSWSYEVVRPGFKYNMTDIAGAMGLQQLKKADMMHGIRKRHAALYTSAFADVDALETPVRMPLAEHSWHLYVIRLRPGMLRIDRARFIEELRKKGVYASVHFISLHLQPYYRHTYGYRPEDFPVAASLSGRIVSLPFYPGMSGDDLRYVIDCVKETVRENAL